MSNSKEPTQPGTEVNAGEIDAMAATDRVGAPQWVNRRQFIRMAGVAGGGLALGFYTTAQAGRRDLYIGVNGCVSL